jgi:DNA replication protein DnaC
MLRAFQVIVGQFVMTYYQEAEFNFVNRTGRQEYLNNRKNLAKMINLKDRLIMFSGAGGSGKTAVINQVMMYAFEFCRNLGVPFNQYTIRVTAITGIAATLINGEILDSAALTMKNTANLTQDHRQEWKHTQLLIIDEISFYVRDKIGKSK